jgi:hypothetical protein
MIILLQGGQPHRYEIEAMNITKPSSLLVLKFTTCTMDWFHQMEREYVRPKGKLSIVMGGVLRVDVLFLQSQSINKG